MPADESDAASTGAWNVGWIGGPPVSDDGRALWNAVHEAVAGAGGSLVEVDAAGDLDHCTAVIGRDDARPAVEVVSATRVGALVLVDAAVGPDTIDDLAELDEVAVLTVVDPRRRDLIVGAVEGHLASRHPDSDIVVDEQDPATVAARVVSWLQRRATSGIVTEEVSLRTPDGWLLGADLFRPAPSSRTGSGWPAVVLMHSGRSDRVIFHRLGRLLATSGVVALALDWRGRGTSTNLGHFVEFTAAQQAAVRVDVTTAYDWLASLDGVDGQRLGVLGVAHGAGYGADGALCDPRTRAIAMLTAHYVADDAQREVLQSGRVAGLYVTCRPHPATTKVMQHLFELSAARGSRMLVYPEGVLGYQLFELHPDLEPTIATWFAEVMA